MSDFMSDFEIKKVYEIEPPCGLITRTLKLMPVTQSLTGNLIKRRYIKRRLNVLI